MSGNTETPPPPGPVLLAHAGGGESPKGGTPTTGERLRDKIYISIIVAALSFAGGVGGTLLASHFEANKWERETIFGMRQEIFAKRMELLERTIKAVNRLQILDIYEASGSYSLIEGESLIRSGKVAASSLATVTDGLVRVKETQAELSAVMTLDAIYFGPKTKRAVVDLQKALGSTQPWWRVDQAKIQALLDATAAELKSSFI